jgi:hypothetical protein
LNVSHLNINVAGDRKRATAIGIQQLMGESSPSRAGFLELFRVEPDLLRLFRTQVTLVESLPVKS